MPVTLQIKINTQNDKVGILFNTVTPRAEATDDEAAMVCFILMKLKEAFLDAGVNLGSCTHIVAEPNSALGEAIRKRFE